jgi:lipoyl-dependent peroxiredoxin
MPTAERRAEVVWNGNLQSGSGTFDLASSGAWTGANVSFATRTENPTCVLDLGSLKITSEVLDVHGRVPGIDADAFQQAVEQADQVCPVTNALRGSAEIQVNATLD